MSDTLEYVAQRREPYEPADLAGPMTVVDSVIAEAWNGSDTEQSDAAQAILAGRAANQRASALALSYLIRGRENIGSEEEAEIRERLESLYRERPLLRSRIPLLQDTPAHTLDVYKQFDFIQKQIEDLQRRERDGIRNQWRDTISLKRDLIAERLKYQAFSSRMKLLLPAEAQEYGIEV